VRPRFTSVYFPGITQSRCSRWNCRSLMQFCWRC